MSYSKYLFFLIIIFSELILSACKKDWLDVNYNPRALTENNATPDLLLPTVLDVRYKLGGANPVLQSWMGYWCLPESPVNLPDQTYRLIEHNLIDITAEESPLFLEKKAMDADQKFYAGIAKIIKALEWSRLVDAFNNVPYTEAYKPGIRQPRYDDGQFIYEDLMKELDLAVSYIKNAAIDKNIGITTADVMFHGDKNKWIRFANTLKLRLLIHQSMRTDRASYIQEEINKIQAEGSGFLESGEDAAYNIYGEEQRHPMFHYSRESIYSAFFEVGGQVREYWEVASANTTAMDILKNNNDPRLAFFYCLPRNPLPPGSPEPFVQPPPEEFRGNRFGLQIDQDIYPFQGSNYVSQIGGIAEDGPVTPESTGIIKGYDMDAWVMTSIESLFLQAEAIQRGWLPGNAEEAYENAVKESFRWLNVGGNSEMPSLSDEVFEDWYQSQVAQVNPEVSWAAASDKYKLLMFQKYVAFNGIEPFESWVDYRRNGAYPQIPLSYNPDRASNIMPIRLPYMLSEYSANTENIKAQGEINIFTSKIWWMP